jgi:hypothetical protein
LATRVFALMEAHPADAELLLVDFVNHHGVR